MEEHVPGGKHKNSCPPPHNSKPHGCEKGVELVKGCQIREGAFIKETCYYSGPNESKKLFQITGIGGGGQLYV